MERKYINEILDQLELKHLIILVGPRQSGKTTALRQLQNHIQEESFTSEYVNLENPLVLESVNEHPENLPQYAGFFTRYDLCGQEIIYDSYITSLLQKL